MISKQLVPQGLKARVPGLTLILVVILLFLAAGSGSRAGLNRAFASGPDPSETQALGELKIGDRVVDPSWEWEFRLGEDYSNQLWGSATPPGESKPVVWIVVAKDHYGSATGVTLLSEELIGLFTFDDSAGISAEGLKSVGFNHWGNSGTGEGASRGLRPWLNSTGRQAGTGFYRAFPEDFRALIKTVTIPNRAWQDGALYYTEDKVFIPSATELGDPRRYDRDLTYEVGTVYPYFAGADARKWGAVLPGIEYTGLSAPGQGDYQFYWTRSPRTDGNWVCTVGLGEGGVASAGLSDGAVRAALNLDSAARVTLQPNSAGAYEILSGIKPGDQDRSGTHRVLYIPVQYRDSGAPRFTINELKIRPGMVSKYFYEQSYGAVEIDSEFMDRYIRLDKTQKEYEAAHRIDRYHWKYHVLRDALEKAGVLPDHLKNLDPYYWDSALEGYDAVVVIAPDTLSGAFAMRSYNNYPQVLNLVYVEYLHSYGAWAHELGHALFKWFDYYGKPSIWYRGDLKLWGVMGDGARDNPPPEICSYHKVEQGWLQYKDLGYGSDYRVGYLHDLAYGDMAYRYKAEAGGEGYIIIEGRNPAEENKLLDPHRRQRERRRPSAGVQLYYQSSETREIEGSLIAGTYLYSISSNSIWGAKRVTLTPGDSYISDLYEVELAAKSQGDQLMLNILKYQPRSRRIFSLAEVDLQNWQALFAGGPVQLDDYDPESEFDINLRVYAADGSMVGVCPESGEYKLEIAGARASGSLGGGGPEWISVPEGLDVYYELDLSGARQWLDELMELGALEAAVVDEAELGLAVTVRETLYDEKGEKRVSETIEQLEIAGSGPAASDLSGPGFNFIYPAAAAIALFIMIVWFLARTVSRRAAR